MFNSALQISFMALPCTDIKYYVQQGIESNFNEIQISISNLNKDELFNYFDRRILYIAYKQSPKKLIINQKEFAVQTNNLLSAFKYDVIAPFRGNFKEKPNYEVLYDYIQKYGIPFCYESIESSNIQYTHNIYDIIDEINNLSLIKEILNDSIDFKTFIPLLLNKVSESIKFFSTERSFKICKKDGRLAVSVYKDLNPTIYPGESLGIYIQNTEDFREQLKDFCQDFDDTISTEEWITWLRQIALDSVLKFLSSQPFTFKSELDGGKPILKLSTSNPFIYFLLLMSNWINNNFDKNQYNKEYYQRPYPKVTAYFRRWRDLGKISDEKYERAKVLAKELCYESIYDDKKGKYVKGSKTGNYNTVRLQIENELLKDGEPHAK